MEYKLDVIVLTHDNLRLLMGCLDCLYAHTFNPFHLIIMDDSKDDMTPQYIEKVIKAKGNVTYLYSEEPYKEGNQMFNLAFEHCKTPYVATVMNSIEVEPNWDKMSVQLLEKDPTVGTVGMKTLFKYSGLIECAGIYMHTFLPEDIGRDEYSHRLSEVYQCEATQWAFAMHRVEAVKGNISEGEFHGFVGVDDIDNCFRIRSKGWKVVYNGVGVAFHYPRATRGSNDIEAYHKNRENLERFYKSWGYWDMFRESNAEVPETLKDIPLITDGRKMLDKELCISFETSKDGRGKTSKGGATPEYLDKEKIKEYEKAHPEAARK